MPSSPLRRRTKHISAATIPNPSLDQYTTLDGLTVQCVKVSGEGLADLKLEMSSLDIAAIILELGPHIKEKYLDNIYQINSRTFLFKFRPGDLNLMIEVGRRIHLTRYEAQIPRTPSQFCMALRKRLRGGRLTNIQQHEFERTAIMQIETAEQAYQVNVEFFRRGNLVIVDASGKISLALTYLRMRDRNIVKGEIFKHAPSSGLNPFKLSLDGLSRIKEFGSIPTTKALVATLSIGSLLAKEILLRSALKDIPANELRDENLSAIHNAIRDLQLELAAGNLNPVIALGEAGELYDITPLSLRSYEHSPKTKYVTFNEAADKYFTALARRIAVTEKKEAVLRGEQKIARMRDMQQKQLGDLSRAIEENNLKGQLIIKNLHHIQEVTAEALARKGKGIDSKEVSLEVQKSLLERRIPIQIESIDLSKGTLHLEIENTDVSLHLTRRPQDDAAKYFYVAKKAKQKMAGLRKAMEDTSTRLETIASEKEQTEASLSLKKRRERAWYEKFRWFVSSEGFLVLGGKDATTNELLIKKHTSPSDIVLHADAHGAPFVVIKAEARTPADSTILEAAQLAVSGSRMWTQKVASGDAFWVGPEQVSKKVPSGQYLARGAFMVTGKKNYVKGVELRFAVGIQINEDGVRVIGGPPSAVRTHSVGCVEVVPGVTARQGLAKRIIFELSRKLKDESQVKSLGVDRVLEFLPPGPGDIVSPK